MKQESALIKWLGWGRVLARLVFGVSFVATFVFAAADERPSFRIALMVTISSALVLLALMFWYNYQIEIEEADAERGRSSAYEAVSKGE